MRRLEARGPVTGRLARTPGVRALLSCTHRYPDGSAALGPCHQRAKGTTPGYKAAGWFSQCQSWCKRYVPC